VATTLLVTNDFPPRIGGIESFAAEVCRLLDQDVVVYTSGPPGAAATDGDRGYPVVRDGGLLLPTPRVRARAVQLLHEHGCSRVVFGAAAPLGLLAPALRRAGASSIVGLTHGHEVWWASLPGSRTALRRIGDGCDHLTTISDYTSGRIAPALSPTGRAGLRRLSPPVDTDHFRPDPDRAVAPHSRGRCVAVGRFVPQKGFGTLLRAWRMVLDQRLALDSRPAGLPELVLVGDGPHRAELERQVDRLALTGTVRLTGPLGRDQVLAELQRADVFALPVRTRWWGLNPEGLGLAALEAAACGLPVVVGRSGGAPETARPSETGYVLDPDDVAGWAGRISALLADRDQARAMGLRGRAYVLERFGLEAARTSLRAALRLG